MAAKVLVAELIEILAIIFEAEFEAVLALVPGDVVDELSGVVAVLVRAIGIIAEAAVVSQGDAQDAPGDWRARCEIGKAQLLDVVAAERPVSGEGIVEPRVAETRLVDDIRRKNARVRAKILFIIGGDLGPTEVDRLI